MTDFSAPLVSVLIPIYNTACYLQEAVGSIRKQTFENFEIIAVNDGSTDKSAEILEALAAEIPPQWRRGLSNY